ncbi:MAG: hypothetical protein IPG12_01360 [Saprospiraceae bacterium]|nr:hypothetical protein [Saprospiraceae bacterium]
MKNQVLFFISFFGIGLSLIAQTTPIVVVSTHGKMNLITEAKKTLRVGPGAVLAVTGTLNLPAKTTAMIFCNGQFKNLKTGKTSVKDICGGNENKRSLSIDGKFGDYIVSAVELAHIAAQQNAGWMNVKDPKRLSGDGWGTGGSKGGNDGWGTGGSKTGNDGWGATQYGKDGWGTGGSKSGNDGWGSLSSNKSADGWGTGGSKSGNDGWGTGGSKSGNDGWGTGGSKSGNDGWGTGGSKSGNDGWGGLGKSIHLILPLGKLEAKLIRFSWSKPAYSGSYKLEILDAGSKVIHSVTVKDTFADIDLMKLVINHEEQYNWKITASDTAGMVSNVYGFSVVSKESKKEAEAKLAKSKIYAKADQSTRLMMEAVVYEDAEFFYDAAQLYNKLKLKDSLNNLGHMLHAAFWMRGGMFVMSDTAIMP